MYRFRYIFMTFTRYMSKNDKREDLLGKLKVIFLFIARL